MSSVPAPEPPAPELSATGRVILGMIAFGKTTGYDIKQLVDKSTRHFWAASYGQIYPELKRLEELGLVQGRSEPSGGRARTVYELTDEGRLALQDWLASDEETLYELRDEGMLKLFFSDSLPERRVENIRAMRTRQEQKLAQLRGTEEFGRLNLRAGFAVDGFGVVSALLDDEAAKFVTTANDLTADLR